MRDILLNEEARAERLLKNNELLEDVKSSIALLARYDAQVLQFDREQIEEHLRAFCSHNYRDVSLNYMENKITYYAGVAGEVPLLKLDSVPITETEMNIIAGLKTLTTQSIAFSALALAKFETLKFPNVDYWLKGDRWGEISRRADVTITEEKMGYELHKLKQAGMIAFPKRIDSCNVHILYASPMDAEDVVMELQNMDYHNLGYAMRAYWGEPFIRCCECGKWIRQSKNGRRKYCDDCAADTQRRNDAAYRRRKNAQCQSLV